jgi:hypothetical protein
MPCTSNKFFKYIFAPPPMLYIYIYGDNEKLKFFHLKILKMNQFYTRKKNSNYFGKKKKQKNSEIFSLTTMLRKCL